MSETNDSGTKIAVLKFGGSVLTGPKAFRRVAKFLKGRQQAAPEEKVVAVVSARKLATDSLEHRARRIVRTPSVRTLDLLWSTGELRSVALLALHLQAEGVPSVGLNVHETGLSFATDVQPWTPQPTLTGPHLKDAIAKRSVVVVPGFLATRSDEAIVSLGRGGSDLSAVLLAIGLHLSHCELVKDIPGYFTSDPHEGKEARHLPSLSFEQALRLAERGCKLVQQRAILVAARANLSLIVRSMEERSPVSVISSLQQGENVEEAVTEEAAAITQERK